ncbi:hypothetical protein BDP81DRAFT_411829 [Colletotrichum phormii]|uniref:Uncharacterized protein n=1 Tax=Colletotrichum phormii TaxID=359342 RepID=A0AAI9ZC09_9PEZI|nr:uncharacterized protein BDP81DRAFT_411829 [Colletotrichum phormii]KAK1621740.1 hypothetical protein BDP81DRAFT_411829 [Colletotrichum phormii]
MHLDSQTVDIVEVLKKEKAALNARLEEATKKLAAAMEAFESDKQERTKADVDANNRKIQSMNLEPIELMATEHHVHRPSSSGRTDSSTWAEYTANANIEDAKNTSSDEDTIEDCCWGHISRESKDALGDLKSVKSSDSIECLTPSDSSAQSNPASSIALVDSEPTNPTLPSTLTERPPLTMAKKKHLSNKKQNRGKGAKQVRKEARKEAAQHLGDQDEPSKQVAIDEKGRKMTVIMGGEAEMDKLWERMQMIFALQFQSKTISEWLEGARAALNAQPNKEDSGQKNFKELELDVERLVSRMRDTISANNRQAAQQGLQTLDLVPADLPLVEGVRIEDVVTGFEADLAKMTMSLNECVSSLTQASGLEDPGSLDFVPLDNDRMRLRGG